MPNQFTEKLDAVQSFGTSVSYFDAIFGEWEANREQMTKWNFLYKNGMTMPAQEDVKDLFFCLIAELSDQDLEECFPELFPLNSMED